MASQAVDKSLTRGIQRLDHRAGADIAWVLPFVSEDPTGALASIPTDLTGWSNGQGGVALEPGGTPLFALAVSIHFENKLGQTIGADQGHVRIFAEGYVQQALQDAAAAADGRRIWAWFNVFMDDPGATTRHLGTGRFRVFASNTSGLFDAPNG